MNALLDPLLIFTRFVVGGSNRLAATAARRVAENLGGSYNPLVICGGPGTGKTHLLTAVAHQARVLDPELHAHYEGIESLVDRLSVSISEGSTADLRTALGGVRLLLLDDLEQIAGKARSQEELLGILDEVLEAGGQVVVACDRAPAEIPALDTRLAERLATGLVVDIAPLDAETRKALVRGYAEECLVDLEPEVVELVGGLEIGSVPELQQVLEQVLTTMRIKGEPISAAETAELLGLETEREETAAAPPARPRQEEFTTFVSDISTAVAAVVETAPWKRKVAEAILRWEAEGVATRRLEAVLDADSAPDVDAFLSTFTRDVVRLREIGRELASPPADAQLLLDPDRLGEAEALLARQRPTAVGDSGWESAEPGDVTVDEWFLDREKFAWDWVSLEERLVEER